MSFAGTYYGLLNNFPGHANSTIAQKVVIGSFADVNSATGVTIDLQSPGVVLHFVSWSSATKTLYGIGVDQVTAVLGVVLPLDWDSVAPNQPPRGG